jgi:hypothetical protein
MNQSDVDPLFNIMTPDRCVSQSCAVCQVPRPGAQQFNSIVDAGCQLHERVAAAQGVRDPARVAATARPVLGPCAALWC